MYSVTLLEQSRQHCCSLAAVQAILLQVFFASFDSIDACVLVSIFPITWLSGKELLSILKELMSILEELMKTPLKSLNMIVL